MNETTVLAKRCEGVYQGEGEYRYDAKREASIADPGAALPKRASAGASGTYYAYLAAALAVTVTAALAARRIFPATAVRDALASSETAWDAATGLGRLFLPALGAFIATFLLAFSPFAIPAALGTLALYGAWAGYSFFALICVGDARSFAAAALCALSAMILALFAARACALSPAARTMRFSAFDGRREAARLTLSFFTHSGAAAAALFAAALIYHMG